MDLPFKIIVQIWFKIFLLYYIKNANLSNFNLQQQWRPPFSNRYNQGWHNALKSTVNRKGQKRRIWLLPTQTLSYGEPKFIVILLPCHTTMLKSHIMKYFTFKINLLGEKWKFCNFSFRPPRNALKVLK